MKPSWDEAARCLITRCERSVQRETYIKVGATAGLRLLPGGKADEILAAVKTHLLNYPFKVDNVSIIDGGCLYAVLGFPRESVFQGFLYDWPPYYPISGIHCPPVLQQGTFALASK